MDLGRLGRPCAAVAGRPHAVHQGTSRFSSGALPEPWQLLLGRSHREGAANGRVNIAVADGLDLIDRSMLLCYEAIEFEPTVPAAVLQFDIIRRNLKDELRYAPQCAGVMGSGAANHGAAEHLPVRPRLVGPEIPRPKR